MTAKNQITINRRRPEKHNHRRKSKKKKQSACAGRLLVPLSVGVHSNKPTVQLISHFCRPELGQSMQQVPNFRPGGSLHVPVPVPGKTGGTGEAPRVGLVRLGCLMSRQGLGLRWKALPELQGRVRYLLVHDISPVCTRGKWGEDGGRGGGHGALPRQGRRATVHNHPEAGHVAVRACVRACYATHGTCICRAPCWAAAAGYAVS